MRRWRVRTDRPGVAHCWAYQDKRLSDGTFPPGFPICGVNSVPQQNWTSLEHAALTPLCKRCLRKQAAPTAGQSGTTR